MNEIKIGDKVLVEAIVTGKSDIEGNNNHKIEIRCKYAIPHWVNERHIHPMPTTKTYEDGLNEAWETARRIGMDMSNGGLELAEVDEIFGTEEVAHIFRDNTAAEAAAKIAAWEDRKRIHVGDVVKTGVSTAVVTFISSTCCNVVHDNGMVGFVATEDLTKTGRTVDIKAVLEAIGGGD